MVSPRRLVQYEERMRHMATAEALATARKAVQAKVGALQAAIRAVKVAEDASAAAVEARRQKRADLSALKQESEALNAALTTSFECLARGTCFSLEEAQGHMAKVQFVGRRLRLEADLLDAFAMVAMKRPCDRFPHDIAVLRSMEAGLQQCAHQLEGHLARASREALNAMDAAQKADAAVSAAKEHHCRSYEAVMESLAVKQRLEQAAPCQRWRRSLVDHSSRAAAASGAAPAGSPPRPAALEDAHEQGHEDGLEAPALVRFWEEDNEEGQGEPESQEDSKHGGSKAAASSGLAGAGRGPAAGAGAAGGEGGGEAAGGRGRGGRRGCGGVAARGAAVAEEPKAASVPEHLKSTACVLLVILANGDAKDLAGLRGLSQQDVHKILAARERSGPLEDLVHLPRVLGRRLSVNKLLQDNESA